MNTDPTDLRDLAIRLLAGTGHADGPSGTQLFLEGMDALLTRLAGKAGSRSLLTRALALAQPAAPWLKAVQIPTEGRLTAFAEVRTDVPDEELREGGIILVAQVLALLYTFIGERLTLQLINEEWPETATYRAADLKDPER